MTNLAISLQRSGLLRGLDDAKLTRVIAACETVHVRSGAPIVREGEPGDAMFVILAGEVRVVARDLDGREVVLARQGPGELFGEQALLSAGSTRGATVQAISPVQLARLSRGAFELAISGDITAREELIARGRGHLRNWVERVSTLSTVLQRATARGDARVFADGEVLFREGDQPDVLHVVQEGIVAIHLAEGGGDAPIRRVGRGGCVGELGLIDRAPRSATAVADGQVRTLVINREEFDAAYAKDEALRDMLAGLRHVYELPRRGVVTQYASEHDSVESITTLYQLPDGRRFAARRNALGGEYTLRRLRELGAAAADEEEVLVFEDAQRRRELTLAGDLVTAVRSRGLWADSAAVHGAVLDGLVIDGGDRDRFALDGTFRVEAAPRPDCPVSPVACRCLGVTVGRILGAIKGGDGTLRGLQRATGCGTVCGGCIPGIVELLGVDPWTPAVVARIREEAPGIRSFLMVSGDPSFPRGRPGQHVVVEGVVRGLPVRRPYTITSAGAVPGQVEIMVKREDGGVFSSWLFDELSEGASVRLSRPGGEFVADLEAGPVGLFVAGVGVTPALAVVRHVLRGQGVTRVLVHYSGRSRASMAGVSELLQAADDHEHIEVVLRETTHEGRLGRDDVVTAVGRNPGATWLICGPPGFADALPRLLHEVGVSAERVLVEAFESAAGPATPTPASPALVEALARRLDSAIPDPRPGLAVRLARWMGAGVVALLNGRLSTWRVGGRDWSPVRRAQTALLRRLAGLERVLPYEILTVFGFLSEGAFRSQVASFRRLEDLGRANRQRAHRLAAAGAQVSAELPDGDSFNFALPNVAFAEMPPDVRVDTDWRDAGEGLVLPVIVTRSATAIAHFIGPDGRAERGSLPFHFGQQMVGARGPLPPGRKAAGVFMGQVRDNLTWQEDRALFVEALAFTAMDGFTPQMVSALEGVVAAVEQVAARDPGHIFDLVELARSAASCMLLAVLVGDAESSELFELAQAGADSVPRTAQLLLDQLFFGGPVSEGDSQLNAMRDAALKIVDRIRAMAANGELDDATVRSPFISAICAGSGEPDEDLERLPALVIPLFFAGHETTTHILALMLHRIAFDESIARRVDQERQRFRAARGDGPATVAEYAQRPVAFALIAETLRMSPPVGALPRTAQAQGRVPPNPDTGIGGCPYAARTHLFLSFIGVHYDPKRWPEPETFRIDRFLNHPSGSAIRAMREREEALDFIAFGHGPTRCPGQHFAFHEMILALDTLLDALTFELVDPDRPVIMRESPTLGPAHGAILARIRPLGGV